MLVLNDFAHVHNVELALSQCYAKHLRHDAPEHNASELARDLARRDMVRYLTERAVRMATLLANAPLSSAPRVVYRTSSPAAERWLRAVRPSTRRRHCGCPRSTSAHEAKPSSTATICTWPSMR